MTAERPPQETSAQKESDLLQKIVSPMIPRETDITPLYLKERICEADWNGLRAMIHIEKGNDNVVIRIKPRTKKLNPKNIAAHFPELKVPFQKLSKNHSLILDGFVVSGDGKTMEDMKNTIRRLSSGPSHIMELEKTHPCQFVAIDIIHKDGQNLFATPLETRKHMLNGLLRYLKGSGIYANDFTGTDHTSFMRALKFGGYEAIVYKKKNSAYHPGHESNDWLRFSFRTN